MKARTICSLVTLALVAAFSANPAHAGKKDKPKRLSISISGGIRPDMAALGSTIMQDGSIELDDSTMASQVYATGDALMSDRDNMTIAHNSAQTESTVNALADYQVGNSMLGAEFGIDVRYELDDLIKFPLYIKTGFYLSDKISGGEQSRTLGDVATGNGELAALLAINGEDPNDYVGGKMDTTWDAGWYEIPFALGIKVPVKRDYTFAYGSFGVSYFKGGFSVGIDVDEAYSNVLCTHLTADEDAIGGVALNNQSPGAVSDVIRFEGTAVGLNYGLGAQVHAAKGIVVFVELNSSGAGATVKSQGLKDESKALLTSLSSDALAESDDQWFDNLAYPVVFGGATARVGVRYYLF